MRPMAGVLLLIVMVTGCSTRVMLLNPSESYSPVTVAQVRITIDPNELQTVEYVSLAEVWRYWGMLISWEDHVEVLREKAGQLGANAIMRPQSGGNTVHTEAMHILNK